MGKEFKAMGLNSLVRVKLTEKGKRVYLEVHEALLKGVDRELHDKTMQTVREEIEKDCIQITLHTMMSMFGPYMVIGAESKELPIEMNMEVEVDDGMQVVFGIMGKPANRTDLEKG